jgi:Leucine-rich repeat (LRR) protein
MLCIAFGWFAESAVAASEVAGKTPAFACADVTEIPQAECDALVSLYNATNGPSWTNRTGWLNTNTPCSWHGVTCQAGHVAEIRLSRNQLSGPLPADLADLRQLRVLVMEFNSLSGNLPPELGLLAELRELSFFNNQFDGSIPPQYGSFARLERLSLSDNRLTGAIPVEMGNLSTLTHMRLSNNRLSGGIPPELGNLANLQLLSISQTYQLTGPIPPELGNLSNLQNLYLYSNALTGPIPPELGRLTNLRILYLFSNRLSGVIPFQIWQLRDLQEIWLSNTQLIGIIPADIGNLSALRYLRISNTGLTGALPRTLTSIPLASLQFSNTSLCEPGEPEFQSWLAGITDLTRTGVICTSLALNYTTGASGSYFTVNGYGFPLNATATISVNGAQLGASAVNSSGQLSVELDTRTAEAGWYVVTASVNPSASAPFMLAPDQPVRPQSGPGPYLVVPPGVAYTRQMYLPLMLR